MAEPGRPRRLLSIRHRLMAGVMLVHAVLMALLVVDQLQAQARFLTEQSRAQTLSLAQTMAVAGASWVMASDVVGLQEVVGSVARGPDVRFAMVVDPGGRVIAHSEPQRVGQFVQDPVSLGLLGRPPQPQTLIDDADLIDVAVPVLADGRLIAWSRVGTGQERIAAELARTRRDGVAFALAAVALGAMFAAMLARGLIQGLERLVDAIGEVRAGRRGIRVGIARHDEIGMLGEAFDGMSASLESSEAERQQAMQALKESEERFRDLCLMSADWFWEQDAELRFTAMSAGLPEVTRIDRSRTIGLRRWELPFVERDEALWAAHRQALERHEPIVDFVYTVLDDTGQRRWFMINGRPLFDAGGRFIGYRGVGRDITERRRAEAARQALEAQLREAQKMEAIGTLAGGIAHDFNNILGAVLGHASLAREELPAGHPVLGHLDQIARSGARARSLVRQILSFSRRGSGERRDLPLQPLLDETLAMLRATLPASVQLQARPCGEALHVHADPTQLQQVLMNLCTNAWQALQGRPGRVELGLQPLHVSGDTAAGRPAGLAPGDYAHLWVADTGTGMDAATRARIFEPFFTTKPEGQGTGLSLSMVHGIVAAHSGCVTVDTAPGCGSTFHVYLPLVASGAEAGGGDAAPAAPPPPGHGEHVLYVDDDEVMLLLVEQLLGRLGYRVRGFVDAGEALAALRDPALVVDLVVTDYNMPRLSGLDVARGVAEARPGLPVVISSGRVSEELRRAVGVGNVRGVVQKEQTIEQLGGVVARVLAASRPPAAAQATASSAMKS